jgi:hypothetical protein
MPRIEIGRKSAADIFARQQACNSDATHDSHATRQT